MLYPAVCMTMIDEANAGWRRARIVIEVYIVRCRRLYSSMLRRHMMTGQETSHPSWRIRGRLWGTPMRTETLRLLAAQDEMLSFVIRTRPRADRRVRHRRKMNEIHQASMRRDLVTKIGSSARSSSDLSAQEPHCRAPMG